MGRSQSPRVEATADRARGLRKRLRAVLAALAREERATLDEMRDALRAELEALCRGEDGDG